MSINREPVPILLNCRSAEMSGQPDNRPESQEPVAALSKAAEQGPVRKFAALLVEIANTFSNWMRCCSEAPTPVDCCYELEQLSLLGAQALKTALRAGFDFALVDERVMQAMSAGEELLNAIVLNRYPDRQPGATFLVAEPLELLITARQAADALLRLAVGVEAKDGLAGEAGFPAAPRPEEAAGEAVVELMDDETAEAGVQPEPVGIKQYVTLDMLAALVNRSKRTLEKLKTRSNNPFPAPPVEGGGGKPAEWDYGIARPWLVQEYGKPLPEHFPADRFRDARADRS
jgi:hypothetical protein